jgi:hypothetical protein
LFSEPAHFGRKPPTAAFLDAMSDGTLPPTLGSAARKPPSRLLREGFRNVYNPKGGIDAWSLSIDPSVPRY